MNSELNEYSKFFKYVLMLENIASIRKSYMMFHDKVFAYREEIKFRRLQLYKELVDVLESNLPMITWFSSKKDKQYVQLFHLFKNDLSNGIIHQSLIDVDKRFKAIPPLDVFNDSASKNNNILVKTYCNKEIQSPKVYKKLELVWLHFLKENEDCFSENLTPYIDKIIETSNFVDDKLTVTITDLLRLNVNLPPGVTFLELSYFFDRRILFRDFNKNRIQNNDNLHHFNYYPQYYYSSTNDYFLTIDDYMVKITGYLNNINLIYDLFYSYYKNSLINLSIIKQYNSDIVLKEAFENDELCNSVRNSIQENFGCHYLAYALWKSIKFEDSYFSIIQNKLNTEYLSDLMSYLSIAINKYNDDDLMERLKQYPEFQNMYEKYIFKNKLEDKLITKDTKEKRLKI